MQNKRNISIQFIRIIAMLMIIFDHMLNSVSFPMRTAIVQVANSGVFIFLFISGFLFGNRHINHWLSWCVLATGMYIAGYFVGDRIISDKTDRKIYWSRIRC